MYYYGYNGCSGMNTGGYAYQQGTPCDERWSYVRQGGRAAYASECRHNTRHFEAGSRPSERCSKRN